MLTAFLAFRMRGGTLSVEFTVASVFRWRPKTTQSKQRQVLCDDGQCRGAVLYLLAYLRDAIWWTLAAARDVNHAHTNNLPDFFDGTWVADLLSSLFPQAQASVAELYFSS